MKKLFALTAALAFGLSAFADDFNLYYDLANQSANKIESVSNLQKLVFEDGNLVVVLRDGTSASLPTKGMTRLYFSTETAVGIDGVKEETSATKKGEVHDLTGRILNVDPDSKKLPKGIYIIDGQKVIVK
ncbi:MAG: hypothetical protein J1F40_08035 [Prevotellaceae bacterium]|nr:hypothetical protein [Prevotellaceae bacterium]